MNDMTHTKTRETASLPDGSVQVTSKSYADKLTKLTVEITKSMKTNRNDLLKDIVSCLDVLQETEDNLIIQISKRAGEPKLITKTWTVTKEYYGK